MKGLIKTIIIIAALIVVGIGASAIITIDLINRLAAARERGYEEGLTDGYVVGFEEGNRVGYQEGSKVGYVKGNEEDDGSSDRTGFYFLYNPTYDEVREILSEREKILAEGEKDSAKKIHDYAEANGIRAAYVRCPIARKAAEGMVYIYQLVAFETVDKGLVVIEPWSSEYKEVNVEVGKRYGELNGLPARTYDDTITKITIVW